MRIVKKIYSFFIFFFFSAFIHFSSHGQGINFSIKPYLQIGEFPDVTKMDILWQSTYADSTWKVEYAVEGLGPWRSVSPLITPIIIQNTQTQYSYQATLTNLLAGERFHYRLLLNSKIVFESTAQSLKSAKQNFRIIAMGDVGAGTPEAKRVAGQVFVNNPDMVVIPGDIVYDRGLISDYEQKFWPIYNRDSLDTLGAPLMRAIPFVAAPGNHDTEERDLVRFPTAQAYFYFWNQPRNGFKSSEGSAAFQQLNFKDEARANFIKSTGNKFPTMANFSFDYGNSHWLVLDANGYVDWTNTDLVDWVENDLKNSENAQWKFILFHHPSFNSSIDHFEQQQMRLLSPVFEKHKVDIVFMGHVHNYQRSFPLTFSPDGKGTLLMGGKGNTIVRGRVVNGHWLLDKKFDGVSNAKPNGVIYIVTGAGGNDLYNPEQESDLDSWQKFTVKFNSTVHSFSILDVNGTKLIMRQVSINGDEIDRFIIIK